MDWVFIPQVGDDILRMMLDGGEELEDAFSYFLYQVDICLVRSHQVIIFSRNKSALFWICTRNLCFAKIS